MKTMVLAFAAAALLQNPAPVPQQKAPEKPPPAKRVRVDLSGFELGTRPPARPSTQIGGGTRSTGEETTLLAPVIGRCYTDAPVLEWTHGANAQSFEVRFFDEAGVLLARRPVSGRRSTLPDGRRLPPGGTLQWSAQPSSSLLGGPSAKSTIRRLTAAEIEEIARQLDEPGHADADEWHAQVFTDRRLWYDAVAFWSALIQKYPERADLREKRGQVYDQLTITQSLADEDFVAAETLRARKR